MESALHGVRVLDLTTGIAGPLAAMLLADFGADVVKVEPPQGDPGRAQPGFAMFNRNKRSLVVDPRVEADRRTLVSLLAGADICVTGSGLDLLGFAATDFEWLTDRYPALIHLHAPSYLDSAPWAGGAESNALLSATLGPSLRQSSFDLPRYIVRRLLLFIPTAFGAGLVTFLLVKIIPGGPGHARLGEEATPEALAVVDRQLGLDRPLVEQFGSWLGRAVTGDLGQSFQTGQPVSHLIAAALPTTVELVIIAILATIAIAIPVGVFAAKRAGRASGRWIRSLSGLGLAVPDFFLALVLIVIFSVWLGVLPRLGYPRFTEEPLNNLYHVVLPVLPMILGGSAIVIRQVSAAMVDALASDYTRTARAMGLPERVITWRYAFRAALPTVLNVVALLALSQLGVTLILERIFVLPGMGGALVNAIANRDYTLILGVVLVYVLIALVVNLIVDIVSGIVNPATRGE